MENKGNRSLYIIIAVLVAVLALVTVAALAFGVLSMLGVVRLARCSRCKHLTITDARSAPGCCPQCRHEHLTHPLASLHHLHLHRPLVHH